MAGIESLPNEVLFMIIRYLSSSDLIQAFYGLNARFDRIIYQSIDHFIISPDTAGMIVEKDMSKFRNFIEQINCHHCQLPFVFTNGWSYMKLHTVLLRCSDGVTVELKVDGESAKYATESCLNILSRCDILTAVDDERICPQMQLLPCSFINRLSIEHCSQRSLLALIHLVPNLCYLRIKQLSQSDEEFHSLCSPDVPLKLNTLKQLHISATMKRLTDMTFIGKMIEFCQTSLEHVSLEISLEYPINGYDLQRMLEPCVYLRKIDFAFNCSFDNDEDLDILSPFRTDWWLDSHQPLVLIFHSNPCEMLILSMPCHFDSYVWFPIDLDDWRINKDQLDSKNFYFTKQKSIRLSSRYREPITKDLVYLMGQVFQAWDQELCISHSGFVSSDVFIDQILSTRIHHSTLPKVTSLDLNTCDIDQLDPKTLVIWLLLAPNVRVLKICRGSTGAKIQLFNRLKTLLDNDQRLKRITDSIEEVHLFFMFDSSTFATKQVICQMYSSIFRKTIIRR